MKEECKKCGELVALKKYNPQTDLLEKVCAICGYKWTELPRDAKETTIARIKELRGDK